MVDDLNVVGRPGSCATRLPDQQLDFPNQGLWRYGASNGYIGHFLTRPPLSRRLQSRAKAACDRDLAAIFAKDRRPGINGLPAKWKIGAAAAIILAGICAAHAEVFATGPSYTCIDQFPDLPDIAARLGVKANVGGGTVIAMCDGRSYSLLALVNALLDRVDRAEKATRELP